MWARIDDGRVAETTENDPAGRFHPSLVWVECPATVAEGWTYDGAAFSAPPPPPALPVERVVTGTEFLALFTAPEVAALWACDPRVMAGALKVAAQDRANLSSPDLAALLDIAVDKGALTAARKAQIIAGQQPAG